MSTYRVEFRGATFATDTVEAEDESEAIEKAFADGFPKLCNHCSGYSQEWSLEIPEDPATWEPETVTGPDGQVIRYDEHEQES